TFCYDYHLHNSYTFLIDNNDNNMNSANNQEKEKKKLKLYDT
ncbi:306_t:CDS:2, partial [Funneliformis geosporum]